jgi:proteasome lid subunit RPN8/RPN11
MKRSEPCSFVLAGASWSLRIEGSALKLLSRRAQRRWYQREAVGQLFTSDLTQPLIIVDEATVLKPTWSSWSGVGFDVIEAMRQRERLLKKGLHCVGIWHTHPEPSCSPSPTDARLAADHAKAARPVLNGLVFAIVSNQPFPDGWYIGVHDGTKFHQAAPASCEVGAAASAHSSASPLALAVAPAKRP